MSQIICVALLVGASAADIIFRKIPVEVLIVMNIGAVVYQSVFRKEEIAVVAGGMAVGGIFLFISRITKESVGYGDSLGILGLGIYLGFWKLIEVLAGAFFLLSIGAVFVLAGKKMSRKSTLPFYPFLTVSYIICLASERGIG